MSTPTIDLQPLRRALSMLTEAQRFWSDQADGTPLKPFNDLLREAADAGLLSDPLRWRRWRDWRNATSHAYDEAKAQAVAQETLAFAEDATDLLAAMEDQLAG